MKSLQEIGIECNTDKATYHRFCDFYDKHLTPIRNESINLFEIGIFHGESLTMWEKYFDKGMIYSIDKYDLSVYNKDRIITSVCDQSNRPSLKNVYKDIVFDVIIDDGGHKMNQQLISFGVLFERLKSGGIYIIEDLHTSNYEGYRDFKPFETSALFCLQNFIKCNTFTSEYLTKEENDYLTNNIKSIEIYTDKIDSITSMIYKK